MYNTVLFKINVIFFASGSDYILLSGWFSKILSFQILDIIFYKYIVMALQFFVLCNYVSVSLYS